MTYSILGRDPETGELGVAVQSQAFNTGAAVPWARPGVGVIATQSFTDRRYGYRGLELLAAGATPQAALDELREPDALTGFRQVAFMDASGATAQWTGEDCIPHAGNAAGENWCAQGNMLAADAWIAMGDAFTSATGSLAQRLLAALDAAEAEGGDWRGRGGAGIVVVPAEGEPWERVVDLRVEDGDDSLVQLRRLLDVAEGYRRANGAQPASAGAEQDGLPDSYVRFLAVLDAAGGDDQSAARRLLDGAHRGAADVARGVPAIRPPSRDAVAWGDPDS